MKKLGLILFLTGSAALSAVAQEQATDSWPHWTISKDVQRSRFRNLTFTPVSIKTGNSDWITSKGVQRINKDVSTQPAGTVQMTGYPTWTISKGAARMQHGKKK
jgi:hypothetical protein